MADLYQILLLTDDDKDAELIKSELSKINFKINIQRIREEELVACLKYNPPYLVISDYKLSELSGIEALQIVRKYKPNLPFIVVSEPIGEERTVDLMLEGATDFATKGNIERLRSAVKKELQNFEQGQKKIERYRDRSYQMAGIGHWELDVINEELYWSDTVKKLHEVDLDYSPNLDEALSFYKEGKDRQKIKKVIDRAIELGDSFEVELRLITAKGNLRWIRAMGETEFHKGDCVRVFGSTQDITEKLEAERDLEISEQRFKSLVQDGSDLIAIIDQNANYTYVAPSSESILGISPDEFTGTNVFTYIHNDHKERIQQVLADLSKQEGVKIAPFLFKDDKSEWRWIEATITNLLDNPAVEGFVVNSRDVTDRLQRENKLKESIKEKESLLHEIHHRVKNNLAVVSGMMQLQAFEEENEQLKEKLFASVVRIQTMGTIHELLYQSESLSNLQFDENIKRLVENILQTLEADFKIDLNFNIASMRLNINQAIPCSLIVNEVITNILNHAFPTKKYGEIQINIHPKNEKVYIRIQDNGVGLPENFDEQEPNGTLGLQLIDTLADQLEAEYSYQSTAEGSIFHLSFVKTEMKGVGNMLL